MKHLVESLMMVCLLFAATALAIPAEQGVIESTKAPNDATLTTDPRAAFWQHARPVYATKDKYGKLLPRYRTEIRSRWTSKYVYFLFVCPYEKLNLKPLPNTSDETPELWNWDVAEVFIGSDFKNIRRYKEFELSPQGEWIDLDIDLTKPHHESGWTWNSGFQVAARIDRQAKVWYGAMQIPFSAIVQHAPGVGDSLRINFYRGQGPLSDLKQITWQPTMSETFHVPERFGILKLIDSQPLSP
jgi:hypothetical protein